MTLAEHIISMMTKITKNPKMKWDKVFKNGPSEICGRQPLKNLKGYDLLRQTVPPQIF